MEPYVDVRSRRVWLPRGEALLVTDVAREVTEPVCQACKEAPASMAVRTTRAPRASLQTTIFFDDRVAPKMAVRYCKPCGARLVAGLIDAFVFGDHSATL